ncbi:MAG: nucleotidyltransferase domain-containing protein [Prevotellaceae bacterium]|nr:nucleotidyltransferase domain-containing protein [Prevotellaceae bacterium]
MANFAEKIAMNFLTKYRNSISELCRQYNVLKLFAFGSVLTDKFNENSDVDLIVDFDKSAVKDHFINYFDFKYSLENIFGRPVDLLVNQQIRNKYLQKSIENSKIEIYGR